MNSRLLTLWELYSTVALLDSSDSPKSGSVGGRMPTFAPDEHVELYNRAGTTDLFIKDPSYFVNCSCFMLLFIGVCSNLFLFEEEVL